MTYVFPPRKSEPKIQLDFSQEYGFQIITNSIPLEKKKNIYEQKQTCKEVFFF